MPSPIPGTKGAFETRPREALKPKTPQHERGNPDRAAAVGALRDRAEAGRERRAGAAAGAACVPRQVPGRAAGPLSGESVNAVVPNSGVFVLPRITKPGGLQPGDVGEVEVGDVRGERVRGERRPDPRGRVEVLERDRHAVEGRLRRLVRLRAGLRERLLAADGDVGAELGIEARDPLEVELDELDRRDLPLPDEASLLGRREERELHPGDRIRGWLRSSRRCPGGTAPGSRGGTRPRRST